MKFQHVCIAAIMSMAVTAGVQAQVKIGANPTTITSNAVLDVQGSSGQHTVMFQDGQVGIGTTTPATNSTGLGVKLNVNTAASNNQAIKLSIGDVGKFFMVPQLGFVGAYNLIVNEGDAGIIFPNAGGASIGQGAATSRGFVIAPHSVNENGASGLKITERGYVGIGINSPKFQLEVNEGIGFGGFGGVSPLVNTSNKGAIYWNAVQPGIGEVELVNYCGTGSGGFRFFNLPIGGTPSLSYDIAYIDLAGAYHVLSDARVKTNVQGVTSGLSKVMALHPVTYDVHTSKLLTDGKVTFNADDKTVPSVGFIAQELYKVLPEAVHKPKDDTKEFYHVNYDGLIPVLTKAIQEQQAEIAALKAQVAEVAELKLAMSEMRQELIKVGVRKVKVTGSKVAKR
ncbi:tail fiber domain-containing protein [Spirosoma endophyticum]|uniref:Chaperone of endosialidase n=1 Tax=Spirosoma endophyticum TaxID=662367 RepID=A0A1I2CHW4_9BACT|nr:tail fiber domain-containing protein [Spirosoma endophyticum]SFE67937.1 Chaperone of endosialidase [Spirosoma endophyticum]